MNIRIRVSIVLFAVATIPFARAATETQLSQQTLADPASPQKLRTAVASDGRGYLVAWEAASSLFEDERAIYVRALDADGVPLQPSAIALGRGRDPRIAWNGHEYLIVWGITTPTSSTTPTPSVVGMRLREDGSLIDALPITLVSEVNPYSFLTTVNWSGSQYLITWSNGMALVDRDLQNFRLLPVPAVGGIPYYAATSGGSFIALTFTSVDGGFNRHALHVVPISSSGKLGTVTSLTGDRGNIVGVDGGYAVIWDDETALHFGRLSGDGELLSTSVMGAGMTGFPRLATRDGQFVASWESIPDEGHTRVCAVRLDPLGQTVCSAVSAGLQHDPSIGMSSTSILTAWSDQVNGRDTVRVAVSSLTDLPRVAAGAGRMISDVSMTPAADRRADGSVAAAWSEYNQATRRFEVHLGGRSGKGAALTERVVFATGLDQMSPAVSTGAGRTMTLWTEGTTEPKVRMTIVDEASKAVIATLPLAAGMTPSVVFDGKEWLAAWRSPSGVIRFAVINRDGNATASGAMPATPAIFQSAPAVAWSGKTFFLTWHEAVTAGAGLLPGERIEVTTIDAAGVTSAPLTLDNADSALAPPSIAGSGDRVLVSWGTPLHSLRQALFDGGGKQLGSVIDFAWPHAVSRTRTHALAGGFATLAGSRLALTSSDGRALDAMNVPAVADGGDFAADDANRFTFFYSRSLGNGSIATFAQTIGLPRRHASDR